MIAGPDTIEADAVTAETVQALAAALADGRRRCEVLVLIGQALGAGRDIDSIVQTVVDGAVELTGAEVGAFFYNIVHQHGAGFSLYALSGAPRSAFEHFPMPRNTAVFAPTFTGDAIVRSDDILADPRYGHNPPFNGMPAGHPPVRSYLSAPVVSRSGEMLVGRGNARRHRPRAGRAGRRRSGRRQAGPRGASDAQGRSRRGHGHP